MGMRPALAAMLAAVVGVSKAQPGRGGPGAGGPGGGGNSGQTTSTQCPSVTSCANDGSSNYHSWSLSWSGGKFSGTMVANLCPAHPVLRAPTPSCIQQTFPPTEYSGDGPFPAPTRGQVGFTLNGVSIYGPMEAGFGADTIYPCQGDQGYCVAGLDVITCEKSLTYICGSEDQVLPVFADSCGGHASPYHYHGDMGCDYDHTSDGHSPLIGVAFDGYGIYGVNEDTQSHPTDLDVCGGHVGEVPSDPENGVVGGTYYHYHVSTKPPYTLGCLAGKQTSVTVDECKQGSEYCNNGYVTVYDEFGEQFCYDDDCSCFNPDGTNTNFVAPDCTTAPSAVTRVPTPVPVVPTTRSVGFSFVVSGTTLAAAIQMVRDVNSKCANWLTGSTCSKVCRVSRASEADAWTEGSCFSCDGTELSQRGMALATEGYKGYSAGSTSLGDSEVESLADTAASEAAAEAGVSYEGFDSVSTTTPTPDVIVTPSVTSSSDDVSTGLVVGVSIGSVVVVIIVIVAIYFCCCRKDEPEQKTQKDLSSGPDSEDP